METFLASVFKESGAASIAATHHTNISFESLLLPPRSALEAVPTELTLKFSSL